MLPSDITTASDRELAAALRDDDIETYSAAAHELERRKTVADASHSDLSILNPRSPVAPTFPFDPKTDISADARYLWKRIFIWFWVVPAAATLIYFLSLSPR